MNSSAVFIFSDLCRRISNVSGDIREASFLCQRIAITAQQLNSVLFRDSFLPDDDCDLVCTSAFVFNYFRFYSTTEVL